VLRCLGAVYSITTFIIAITSLLQIRQVAQHRSATCSLQGLSSTQRSARATPSRDLTLGVEEQDRRLVRPMPIPTVSHHQGRAPGLVTKVAVLPPMGEAINPFSLSSLSLLPSFPAAPLNVAAACPLEGCSCSARRPALLRVTPFYALSPPCPAWRTSRKCVSPRK